MSRRQTNKPIPSGVRNFLSSEFNYHGRNRRRHTKEVIADAWAEAEKKWLANAISFGREHLQIDADTIIPCPRCGIICQFDFNFDPSGTRAAPPVSTNWVCFECRPKITARMVPGPAHRWTRTDRDWALAFLLSLTLDLEACARERKQLWCWRGLNKDWASLEARRGIIRAARREQIYLQVCVPIPDLSRALGIPAFGDRHVQGL